MENLDNIEEEQATSRCTLRSGLQYGVGATIVLGAIAGISYLIYDCTTGDGAESTRGCND